MNRNDCADEIEKLAGAVRKGEIAGVVMVAVGKAIHLESRGVVRQIYFEGLEKHLMLMMGGVESMQYVLNQALEEQGSGPAFSDRESVLMNPSDIRKEFGGSDEPNTPEELGEVVEHDAHPEPTTHTQTFLPEGTSSPREVKQTLVEELNKAMERRDGQG